MAAGNTNAVGRGITLTVNDRPGGGRDPIYGDATVTNKVGGLIKGDRRCGHCGGRSQCVRPPA